MDDGVQGDHAPRTTQSRRAGFLTAWWQVEVLVVLGLFALSLAIRWPHLWTIPLWTDEGDEAVIAARLVRFGIIPLSNDNGYNGPIYNYLVAVGLVLLGQHSWVPRVVSFVLGALTVVPTYLLAREILLAGPVAAATTEIRQRAALAAGLAGGLLLGLNAAHIVVNSHIGWGHCLTLLRRAIRLRSEGPPEPASRSAGGPSLVLSGFAWSLAFQSHPTIAPLLPAVVLFILWKHRGWLVTPWPYLAGLAFVIGQTPTLLNSLQRGELVWLAAGLDQRSIYEGAERGTVRGYLSNLYGVVESLGATLAGLLNHADQPVAPLWHPLVLLGLGLSVAALAFLWRSGRPLVALLGMAVVIGLPYLHGQFEPIISRSRYVAPLVPILVAAWAALAVEQWPRVRQAVHGVSAPAAARWRLAAGSGLAVALVVIAFGSSASLVTYYADATRIDRTNARLLQDYQRLLATRDPDELVAVDRALLRDWSLTQGRLGRVVSQWLEVDGVPYTGIDLLPDGRFSGGRQEVGGLAILARGSVERAAQAYTLEEIASHAAAGAAPDRGYAIVRARRRT
jgi:hypothetical protein